MSKTDCQALQYIRQSVLEGNKEFFDFSLRSETEIGTKEYYDERTKKNVIKNFLQEKPSNIVILIDKMKIRAEQDYNDYEDKEWLSQLNNNTSDTFLPAHYEEVANVIKEYELERNRAGEVRE